MRLKGRTVVCGALLIAGLAGCTAHPDEARARKMRYNLSPNMSTMHQTHSASRNDLAVTHDENMRMISGDLGRALYWDRQSRLTREPVPR